MRLFKIRGGVHPQDRKTLSANRPIEDLGLPPLLHIPLQQHIGALAAPAVRRDQKVAKGQLLANSQGMISAPVHAPTSGRIVGIGSYPAHHTSGLNVRTISLQPDGENRWSEDIQGADDPFTLQPEAQAAMEQAAKAFNSIRIARLPTRYPMGSEKHLVQTLTGRETPARGLTADIGVVVHNPATALAVQEALRHGRPLVSRVMTVSGGAIRTPANLRVPLGTPIQYIIDHCGGFTTEPARLISGGPMMGQPMPSTRIPTVKGANGLLALTAAETSRREAMPCIRCAS